MIWIHNINSKYQNTIKIISTFQTKTISRLILTIIYVFFSEPYLIPKLTYVTSKYTIYEPSWHLDHILFFILYLCRYVIYLFVKIVQLHMYNKPNSLISKINIYFKDRFIAAYYCTQLIADYYKSIITCLSTY